MKTSPNVALLIETARGYGRQVLLGIMRYTRLHASWNFDISPGDFEQALPKMEQWDGSGIIARIETPRIAKAVLDSGLPTIALDLSDKQLQPGHPLCRLSEVVSDSAGAARMAAEHLLTRGLRQFAYVGVAKRVWSQCRGEAFRQAITEAGFPVEMYHPPSARHERGWEWEQPRLVEWLTELRKPIGVMACHDDRGREVLEACRTAEMQRIRLKRAT